jgi:hypothetical protein
MEDAMNTQDEWRVEVKLPGGHGIPLSESLAAVELDAEARRELGGQVILTSEGDAIFAYARNETAARAAETEIRKLAEENELEGASITLTRWHPIEESWKDASAPLPATPEEQDAEKARHEAAEVVEEEESGEFDWEVAIHVESLGDMRDLDRKLREQGMKVHRRWKYLMVGAITEEKAEELAEKLRPTIPEGAEVEVLVNPDDLPNPMFVAIGALASRLRDGV